MCIKLTYQDGTTKEYDPNLPVETQLQNLKLASISMKKEDARVSLFLTDLSRAMEFNIVKPFDIEVCEVMTPKGAKARQKIKKAQNKMAVCWLVKELVNYHNHVNKSLEDLAEEMRLAAS